MSHFPPKYHSFLSHHLNSSRASVQVMWVLSSCAAKTPTALHFALCFRRRGNRVPSPPSSRVPLVSGVFLIH